MCGPLDGTPCVSWALWRKCACSAKTRFVATGTAEGLSERVSGYYEPEQQRHFDALEPDQR